MSVPRLALGAERGTKRTFIWALEWPGWCRAGKSTELALEAFRAAAPRYALVARQAGLDLGEVSPDTVEVDETVEGGGATDFGVPSVIAPSDRRPAGGDEAARLADLVEAAWVVFDRVAAGAPAELRKGPRGGGRDRDKVVEHVLGADDAYAREIGVRVAPGTLEDRSAVEAARAAVLQVLRAPSDGTPLAGRKWPLRYAARRIAWHALDHAWEIEDRSEPA